MASLAEQIETLNKFDDDGESDADLCGQAIDILKRLRREKDEAKLTGNIYQAATLLTQEVAFIRVLQKIHGHRHALALEQFKIDVQKIDKNWCDKVLPTTP